MILNDDQLDPLNQMSPSELRAELEVLMRRARLINRELTSRMIGVPYDSNVFAPRSASQSRTPFTVRHPIHGEWTFNRTSKALTSRAPKQLKAQTGIPSIDELPIKMRRAFLVLLQAREDGTYVPPTKGSKL